MKSRIYRMRPDGSELRQLTSAPGWDGSPAFSADGKFIYSYSQRGGLNHEEPLIPVFNPQPYGEIFALGLSDGFTVRLTHNKWEDGVPSWGVIGNSR